jgi:hypothetical protein
VYVETCIGKPWRLPDDDTSSQFAEDATTREMNAPLRVAEGLEESAGWLLEPKAHAARLTEALEAFRRALAVLRERAGDPSGRDRGGALLGTAEATSRIVAIESALGGTPDAADLATARDAARAARDGTVGELRVTAARLLVELAGGLPGGTPSSREPRESENGAAIEAREEYLANVSPAEDPGAVRRTFVLDIARSHVAHGRFAEARALVDPLLPAWCGHFAEALDARSLELSMAHSQGDAAREDEIARSPDCSIASDPRATITQNAGPPDAPTYDALVHDAREKLHHRAAFLLRVEESRRNDLPAAVRRAALREARELAKMRGVPGP